MECPSCQNSIRPGQKFCGVCGQKLESECVQCGTSNPPGYKFCGNCGASLALDSAIILARSGLITKADQKAADLLGLKPNEMQKKPFSLFVDRVDMVVFFSHWNELLSNAQKQTFELTLKRKENKKIYVALECSVVHRSSSNSDEYLLILNEAADNRQVSAQMQYQQDLLGLIFTLTNNISSVTPEHFNQSIDDALKKICLFSNADRSFIYRVNRPNRCLELAYQWCQPACAPPNGLGQLETIPLRQIKRAMVRFLQDQAYVISDVSQLSQAERNELRHWHPADLGALMCHLMHSRNQPIGIIGVAKSAVDDEWPSDGVALVKLLGQVVSDKLPIEAIEIHAVDDTEPAPPTPKAPPKETKAATPIQVDDTLKERRKPPAPAKKADTERSKTQPTREPRNLANMNRPMLLDKLTNQQIDDQQTVFPRDDGLVLLTCPSCGHQDTISMGWFEKLGNAVSVNCPCGHQFAAILEKRRSHRKSVKLDGYFTLKSDLEHKGSDSSIWGPMVVNDLSKTGLRFISDRSELVHPDDLLMVRFNLDNSNQALIHKPARVIATNGTHVGCRFEGDDSYDITLGFYFI